MTSLRAHLLLQRPKDPQLEIQTAPLEALAELLEGPAVVNHHVDVEMLDMYPLWLAPNAGTQDRRYDK